MSKILWSNDSDDENFNIAVALGYWENGRWYPNLNLTMSPGQQYDHNVLYGYIKVRPEDERD